MIKLPRPPNHLGFFAKKTPTIKVIGKSSWDRHAISKLFYHLHLSPGVSPLRTPHESVRIRVEPVYRREEELGLVWAEYIYWPSLGVSYFSYIYVDEPFRGIGFASALHNYYLEELRTHGITKSYYLAGSPEGLAFGLSRGYQPVISMPPIIRGIEGPQVWLFREV